MYSYPTISKRKLRNRLHLAIIISFIGIVYACKKEEKSNPNAAQLEYDGKIQYHAFCQCESGAGGVLHKSTDYNGSAQFFTNSNLTALQNVGELLIGALGVYPDVNNGNTYWFSMANSRDSANVMQFGSLVDFKIAGGGGYTRSETKLYVPEEIYLDTLPFECCNSFPRISISKLPYRIYWNKDGHNKNGVVITPEYDGFNSNLIDSTFSLTSYFNPAKEVPELGYYDLTASDISGIPIGSVMTLYVSRSNSADWMSGSKTVRVEASAETRRSYIITP